MMELTWKVRRLGGQLVVVRWSEGELMTPAVQIERQVKRLIMRRDLVNCGEVGPVLEASLDDAVSAWGTITEAIARASWVVVAGPPKPVVEPDFTRVQSVESGV
jgi:hypothetical protein